MKFTREQLESMTDFQLNVVAANHFYDCDEIVTSPSKYGVKIHADGVLIDDSYNPCESWSDCGDLIDELNLAIEPHFEGGYLVSNVTSFGWGGEPIIDSYEIYHENPRRAVTIVYILIKQQ